jgi:predicted RNA-binding protein with PUA-like domain
MNKNYWLLKSEGTCYSIDDLRNDKKTAWTGIRNYQARNFMMNGMKVGDLCLFYHSSSDPTGVAGIAEVVSEPHLDQTALDPNDEHFDPKATKEKPNWYCVDIKFKEKFKKIVTLPEIKFNPTLKGIMVTQPGSRLSVQPVSKSHFNEIINLSTHL